MSNSSKPKVDYSKAAVHAKQSPSFAGFSSDELSALFAHKDERLSQICDSPAETLVAQICATNPPTYVTCALLEKVIEGIGEKVKLFRREDRAKIAALEKRIEQLENKDGE